ncbi:peptide ABC transporter substrate-binding protein [Candidatus Oscillochloris fontis]|uniref:peptide ABC transporter substrate-binding protein n=1 Tax=Candidatus Oscillochloris fontis TaxID=2496868 RepID=UPI00101D8D2B|nr:peptide ABC transporter substrate-binding protein [Candidatus Oscillochloris fontis]
MRRLLLVLLMGLVLVGCASTRPVPPVFVPISTAMPLGNGGTLIMALGARDPNTLDPALTSDVGSAFIIRQLFSGLVRLDATLDVHPDLAEAWKVSEDGLRYTFTLRADARFADGRPITSADVIFSLERACDPQLGPSLPAATYLTDIVGVREKLDGQAQTIAGLRAIDDRTIEITIDAPKSYFLAKLTHPSSFVVDEQAVVAGGADWTEQPNGSGPFEIEEWRHDQLLVIKRNLNYYRDLPYLDRVRFLIGAAASNAQMLYEQGEIDLTEVPSYALARVQDTSNPLSKELVQVPQLSLYYIGMNVNLPPFDDPKVRQAFSLLLDRQKMVEVSLYDAVEQAHGILPPGIPGYNPDLPLPSSDIDRVRALIAESRYGSIENLPPIVAYGGWAGVLRDVVEQELGLEIEVRGYEDFGDYLAALDRQEFQIYGTGWVADYPDPQNFLDVLFRGGSSQNHSGYDNPEVNALLDQAAVAPDEATRMLLYRQVEQIILADAPVIPIYHDVAYTLVKPYVRGLEITPMGILDLSSVELVR